MSILAGTVQQIGRPVAASGVRSAPLPSPSSVMQPERMLSGSGSAEIRKQHTRTNAESCGLKATQPQYPKTVRVPGEVASYLQNQWARTVKIIGDLAA